MSDSYFYGRAAPSSCAFTTTSQGAMGSVYRGRDLDQNRVVAIKILSPEHARKRKVLARFEREAELMTSLRHPNIVQLYGHGRRGVLPFIAMKYLEGPQRDRRGGQAVAAGLAFLHHHELVHRDVKPQNIFLVSGGRVTILDLGVVRDQATPASPSPERWSVRRTPSRPNRFWAWTTSTAAPTCMRRRRWPPSC